MTTFPVGSSASPDDHARFQILRMTHRKRSPLNACAAFAIGLAFLLAAQGPILAGTTTMTFDFNNGIGRAFCPGNAGNLFTLGLTGPDFRVTKPADDGSFTPNGFVSGNITSNFFLTGNFKVTVDFGLPNFPPAAPGSEPLNESILGVNSATETFLVLRFRRAGSDDIEAYGGAVGPINTTPSSLSSGRYQIERVGNTITGRFAPTGSDTFTTLGSANGYTSPEFQIALSGTQGINVAGAARSTTALDVTFDNLIVEADGVTSITLLNISTRMRALTGENVLIGSFIITGPEDKRVIIRGIGPSLSTFFSGVLANPTLQLFQGSTLLASNNDWKDDDRAAIEATGIPPTNDFESAIVRTLPPGAYTAILRGLGDTTGIGVVEAYDLNRTANSRLANIATRGFVDAGDSVMIGGLIIGPAGGGCATIVVRAIGPSLTGLGIAGALQNPTLVLVNSDGMVIRSNDSWRDSQANEIIATGLQPSDDREATLIEMPAPGSYTAIVRGVENTTGVGLVEVYQLSVTPAN